MMKKRKLRTLELAVFLFGISCFWGIKAREFFPVKDASAEEKRFEMEIFRDRIDIVPYPNNSGRRYIIEKYYSVKEVPEEQMKMYNNADIRIIPENIHIIPFPNNPDRGYIIGEHYVVKDATSYQMHLYHKFDTWLYLIESLEKNKIKEFEHIPDTNPDYFQRG